MSFSKCTKKKITVIKKPVSSDKAEEYISTNVYGKLPEKSRMKVHGEYYPRY